MKKLSIIILMLIMFLPVHVFGGCGGTGPFWFETGPTKYYAYVSNKNGAKAICYENFIEKETLQIGKLREEASRLYEKAKIEFEEAVFGNK